MTKADRYRERIVRGLVRAFDDEAAHLRRYRRIARACAMAGALVFVLALFAALGRGDAAGPWLVVSGAAGGLFLGLAVFFHSSVEQWPVNREFLDEGAVREAGRRYGS